MAVSWRVAWKSAEARAQAWTKVRGERAFQVRDPNGVIIELLDWNAPAGG
jgi:hypothetical protein